MERQLEAVGEGLPNRAQAEEIMQRSLKVLYYRDKSTYNNWSIGFAEKVSVECFTQIEKFQGPNNPGPQILASWSARTY